jgi:peptide/nickel transport system substrate-binding protein
MISAVYKNYATADDGPVPTRPASAFLSSAERHNPYAYDPSAAASMLTANGWTVKKGGTDVCSASAGCGSGVPAGSKLSFKLVYLADNSTVQSQVTDIVKSWSDAGIHVATKAEPFDEVIGTAAPCKPSAQCSWEMADWGGGWIYLPDIEPTGDLQFQTGAGSNSGSYSDPKNDKLIRETITSNATGIFQTWENYLTNHVPVIWQPMSATVIEISKSVRRVEPLDPYYSLTPEYWSFRS